MSNKLCTHCDTLKSIDSFNRDRSRRDGYYVFCRECANSKAREYRQKESYKIKRREASKRYRLKNREKELCRSATRNAIFSGKLTRMPCVVCNKKDSEAHHEDYSKPFKIKWLCKKHHTKHHLRR